MGKSNLKSKEANKSSHHSLKGIGHKDVSLNSMVVSEDERWVYGGGSNGFVMGWKGSADFVSWKLVCETKHNK
ncbi:hypothetical protein Ddye_029110 [Dipteronia dyeriana]|uniref:Uncharacterized protein n=1 Tax=Dipteronia dyeriana TaxID=168575 RepID=A0AAD9TEJ1_9ROSI|nr:hypothetical protein Ddye_029110 [Dipteronia dyeriana]